MKKLTLQTTIPADGKLRLEVPTDLPAGPVEVDVTIRGGAQSGMQQTEQGTPLAGMFAATVQGLRDAEQPDWNPAPPTKSCSGLFLGRLPHDYDFDAVLDEMNTRWKASLLDLER